MSPRRYSRVWGGIVKHQAALIVLGVIFVLLAGLIAWSWSGYGGTFSFNETDAGSSLSGNIQRIQSTKVVPGVTTTAIIFDLKYQATSRIEFGLTNQLTNVVDLEGTKSSFLAKIYGLVPGTQYYYRIVVDEPESNSKLVSTLKTFTTGVASQKTAINLTKSDFWIVPSPSKKQSVAVAALRDDEGAVITSEQPSFSSTRGAVEISKPVVTGGIVFADVTSSLSSRQAANIAMFYKGDSIAETTVVLDPNYAEPTSADVTNSASLLWTNAVAILTVALVAVLLLAGWGLIRLARAK